ncbi:hypothetical protein PG999_001200 [Apiospora kogelbergensis]|uniref:Uncharacterized protein n=1 Tax=Apiospora kogelbergensis TaxID=1337665 RepID=A0AAW0RDY9_9PEZI
MQILHWAVFGVLLTNSEAALGHVAPRTLVTIEAKAVSMSTLRPQTTEDAQLCGYINGEAANPFSCFSGQACLSNKQYRLVGCASTTTAGSSTIGKQSLITTCRDYTDWQVGLCTSLPPGVGCCWNSAAPACSTLTYNYPDTLSGFKIYGCFKRGETKNHIALYPTTSSAGAITTTLYAVVIPTVAPAVTTSENPSNPPTPIPTEPKSTPDDQSSGLSRSDKIALGCGIGIGLPATLAALFTCWRQR